MTDREALRRALYIWVIAEDAYKDEMNHHVSVTWGKDSDDQAFDRLTSESFATLLELRTASQEAFDNYRALLGT